MLHPAVNVIEAVGVKGQEITLFDASFQSTKLYPVRVGLVGFASAVVVYVTGATAVPADTKVTTKAGVQIAYKVFVPTTLQVVMIAPLEVSDQPAKL